MIRWTINIKNKKDSKIIKALLSNFDVSIEVDESTSAKKVESRKPKRKSENATVIKGKGFKSKEELLSFAGSMKGQLISKEHLRSIAWKKRG